MVVFAEDPAGPQPAAAGDAGDDADRDVLRLQHRPLFDMHFEEGGDAIRPERPLAALDEAGVEAFLPHVVGQRPAAVLRAPPISSGFSGRGRRGCRGSWLGNQAPASSARVTMTVMSRPGVKPARFMPATAARPASTPAAPS